MHRSSCRRRSLSRMPAWPPVVGPSRRTAAGPGSPRSRRRRPSTCRARRKRSRTPAARCCRRAAHRRPRPRGRRRSSPRRAPRPCPHGRRRRAVDTEPPEPRAARSTEPPAGPPNRTYAEPESSRPVVVSLRRADRDVGPPVAAHVTHPGDRRSGKVEGRGTANLVAAGAERVQPDRGVEAFRRRRTPRRRAAASGHFRRGAPTTRSGRASPLTSPRPERTAGERARARPLDLVAAGAEGRHEHGLGGHLAEDDVHGGGELAVVTGLVRADRDVRPTVAVDVAESGDRSPPDPPCSRPRS